MQTLRRIGMALGLSVVALMAAWVIGELALVSGPILRGSAEAPARGLEVMRDLSRMLGVALSMLVALCAIAIPLTANVYTPKLIELFVADRVNRLVLGFFVVANAFVIWNAYLVFEHVSPDTIQLRIFVSLLVTLGGLVLIVPYVGYVLRFLVPRTIVLRLERELTGALERALRARPEEIPQLRREVLETVQYLGKIVLRSVERYDRDTVFEGLRALNDVFHTYQARKAALPPEWFRAAQDEIGGLGPELIREAHRQKASVEVAILQEFSLVLPLAINRLPEVVGALAASTCSLGVGAVKSEDEGVREQVTLYFNTFLRSALQHRHADTFYKFVYQYRRFAEEILERAPQHVVRISFFLDYYGHQAVRMGLGFLINVVAYDLASLVELAFRQRAPIRHELLAALIALDRDVDGLVKMPGVVKAQLILAAKLHGRDNDEAVTALLAELDKVPREQLVIAVSQILAAREENFWEIADRRRHLDHVEAPFRPALDELRERLLGPDPALPGDLHPAPDPDPGPCAIQGEPAAEPEPEPAPEPDSDRREDHVTTERLARRALEAEAAEASEAETAEVVGAEEDALESPRAPEPSGPRGGQAAVRS